MFGRVISSNKGRGLGGSSSTGSLGSFCFARHLRTLRAVPSPRAVPGFNGNSLHGICRNNWFRFFPVVQRKYVSTFQYNFEEEDDISKEGKDLHLIGDDFIRQGKNLEAIEIFDKVIALHPSHPQAYAKKAALVEKLGHYKEAIEIYQKVLFYAPANIPALERIAVCYNLLGDHTQALQTYDQLLYVNGEYLPGLIGRSQVYTTLGKPKAALDDLNKAKGIDPKNIYVMLGLAANKMHLGELDKADAHYDEVLLLEPNNKAAYAGKGIIAYLQEKVAKALQYFTQALGESRDNADLLVKRASCLSHLNRFPEALNDVEQALQIDPSFELALMIRGQIYFNTNEHQKAIADLSSFITTHYKDLTSLAPELAIMTAHQKSTLHNQIGDSHIHLFLRTYPSLRPFFPFNTESQPDKIQTIMINDEFIQDLNHRVKVAKEENLKAAWKSYLDSRVTFLEAKQFIDPKLIRFKKLVNEYLKM